MSRDRKGQKPENAEDVQHTEAPDLISSSATVRSKWYKPHGPEPVGHDSSYPRDQSGPQGRRQIVHDVDIKDGNFGRPEASGIEQLLNGPLPANPDDEARLERGFVLFDELDQSFRKQSPRESKEVSE